MTLHAADRHDARQAAAPADADRVAELDGARRLADDAVLKRLAAARQRLHDFQRAVVGRAFLVARDQQADRARDPRIAFDERSTGIDHRGETAFHVGRAAADQLVSLHGRRERIDVPLLGRSARHDVRVAREDERGRRAAAPCPKVVDLAEFQALGREARLLEQLRDQRLATCVGRRDGRAANQFSSEAQCVHVAVRRLREALIFHRVKAHRVIRRRKARTRGLQ